MTLALKRRDLQTLSPRDRHVRITRCARAMQQGTLQKDLKRIYTSREVKEAVTMLEQQK